MAGTGVEWIRTPDRPGKSVRVKASNAEVHTSALKKVEAVFLSVGFKFDRQEGSHRSYLKPGVARPVVIPAYQEVPVFVIRNNLKTAGISRDEYFALLKKAK